MCGIAGILSFTPDKPVAEDELRLMARQLVHRGPDDDGYYLDPLRRCGLAFRRLSIIDLAGGRQPLQNKDGDIQLVFNGEIYNFRELRRELEQRGHRFRTQTDGEVIVHLYEDCGTDCFARLDGMFAIALWDRRAAELCLARDRLGKKPLVFGRDGDRLYFASELKALLALPRIPREIDPAALYEYLIFQYVPAPRSIYRGFRKLLPGHWLKIAARSPATDESQVPYWQVPKPADRANRPFTLSYRDARHRLGELLEKAVEKRLVADVPLGAFLSGGIDSSIVVGLMRKLGVSPLRTFSIGFPDARYDETRYAREVARRFGAEHHEHIVTPQAREILETLAWHYDEPFADSSAIPTYYVSHYTRQSVTVALTGDGGDECFAGYDRYRAARLAARFDRLPRRLVKMVGAAGRLVPHGRAKSFSNRIYRFVSALGKNAARRYLSWVNIFPPDDLASILQPKFAERVDPEEPNKRFERLFETGGGEASENANYVDIMTYLPYDLLTKVDIASMACSLECRCPFLDHELLTFATTMPYEWRLGPGGGKRILKDWAADLLPTNILERPKMGFGIPMGEWFRGVLSDLLRERLLDQNSLSNRIFKHDRLQGLIESHVNGTANFEHPLWALLMLELWAERWQPTGI